MTNAMRQFSDGPSHMPFGPSHMPFLASGWSGLVLFFCRRSGPSRPWKLWVREASGVEHRLVTGMGVEATECSPTAWEDDEGWHVTFVATGQPDDARSRLYRMDGATLESLGKAAPIRPARAGFVTARRVVWVERSSIIQVRERGGTQIIELPDHVIFRVAYRTDDPDELLISGSRDGSEDVFTLGYHLRSGIVDLITCDGRPAYKCTIFGDRVLYAERVGENFEDRRIREANAVERILAAVDTRIERREEATKTMNPRPCCGASITQAPRSELKSGAAQSLIAKVISLSAVVMSRPVPVDVATERLRRCGQCTHVRRSHGKHYCTRCDCPEWSIGSVGSDQEYKTTKAAHECPLEQRAFRRWTPNDNGLGGT